MRQILERDTFLVLKKVSIRLGVVNGNISTFSECKGSGDDIPPTLEVSAGDEVVNREFCQKFKTAVPPPPPPLLIHSQGQIFLVLLWSRNLSQPSLLWPINLTWPTVVGIIQAWKFEDEEMFENGK